MKNTNAIVTAAPGTFGAISFGDEFATAMIKASTFMKPLEGGIEISHIQCGNPTDTNWSAETHTNVTTVKVHEEDHCEYHAMIWNEDGEKRYAIGRVNNGACYDLRWSTMAFQSVLTDAILH